MERTWIRVLGLALVLPAAASASEPSRILGFFPSTTPRQLEAEAVLRSIPSGASFERHFRHLTEEPHPTGSARNMELADYVRDRFQEYGLEDVHFHDTPALLSYGRSLRVELTAPVSLKLKLAEAGNPDDKDSYLYSDPSVVPYHEYAASGDVEAEVVYANGGSPEDFAKLEELGIDVRGKIVIMRYSVPYSYRGYKVYMAESRGALGAIIYSDPADDGYVKGETYPNGPFGPPSHIQWGSIVYDWFGFGIDPFTFHWQQRADGTWFEGPERHRQLPKIPSIPMSHEDAAEILSRLRGPVVPNGWQGGLPFTYHVGPGPVRLRMQVANEDTVRTMRSVIGTFPGTEEPEKWVVVGNHRDAWIYGGVDPSSGTAVLLEAARALGAAVERGFRPRRTIVFANWDGEEDLLGGSTSFVNDHREKLRNDGVVYLNLDGGAVRPDFDGGATPALRAFLREVTKSIAYPDGARTLYDAWAGQFDGEEPEVATIVGATDYTAFQVNVGMSCIDLGSDGPYGVYHSQYDNFFWLSRFGDPGFRLNTMYGRLMAVLLSRLANADVVPFEYSAYATAVLEHLEEVEGRAQERHQLELTAARSAAEKWRTTALAFEERWRSRVEADTPLSAETSHELDQILLQVERAMTESTGLESRPYFKHLIYAPQPTYRAEVLPRIFEAIETRDWQEIPRFEQELVEAFERASSLMERATALLRSP